jgi:anthranilate phosphoribosyltransferase
MGSIRALVVHSDEGLDEFGLGAPTQVAQVDSGSVRSYSVDPVAMGLRAVPFTELQARDLDHAVDLVRGILSGDIRGPERDIVLLNSAAAIHAAGQSDSIEDGIGIAAQSIDFGDATRTLDTLIEISNSN